MDSRSPLPTINILSSIYNVPVISLQSYLEHKTPRYYYDYQDQAKEERNIYILLIYILEGLSQILPYLRFIDLHFRRALPNITIQFLLFIGFTFIC